MVNNEQEMDFDFHFLAASIAPRLLYVSDGNIDTYADPEGSFLTCKEASKAWQLFGATGLGEEEYPPCGKLCGQEIGYYLRKGDHAFTGENWDMLIQFAKKHFC